MKILVIHGPNLNLLGKRKPPVHGKVSIKSIDETLKKTAKSNKATVEIFQSNHEGEMVDTIGKAKSRQIQAILINPAAYTHTSVAIRDAILAVNIPTVEVHL